MDISIVIPLHNEEQSLEQLADELDKVISKVKYKIEVLFVNDASTDATGSILERIEKKYRFVRIITLSARGGQTGCYQVAFEEAAGKYLIRMDGDLQDDPGDLYKFFEMIEDDADMIMGLRTMRKHRKLVRLASVLYDVLVLILFDSPLYTNTSSFIGFKAKYLKGIKFKRNDHRYLPLIAIRRGASRLREIVVLHRQRKYGESKYRDFRKVFFGIQEVLVFFIRLKTGYYDLPVSQSSEVKK